MRMHERWGYRGFLAELMERLELKPGDIVRVRKRGLVVEGMLMPRELLYGDKPILVIRLSNGYKVGIKIDESTCIEKIGTRAFGERSIVEREQKAELPKVALLSTGGTILSKIDYETGAVKPSLNVGELLEWAPELAEVSFIEVREVLRIFSEDMTPALWIKIAEEVYKVLSSGYKGVVIAHGTDTMSYTAAALAFAIRNKPSPIILTGSQRSSDRPSTDSAFNLHAAFIVAVKAPFAESVIVMHGETGDVYALVHRGVKARKMHTSRRDAFQSINDKPIAIVYPARNELRIVGRIYEERGESKEPILENHFDDKVALVKTYPGFSSEIIDFLVDKGYHGIVIEGTGLGHAPNTTIESFKRAIEEEVSIVMTSQCLFGRVNMHVYSTGRKLLEVGVIPGDDMLPETAYVKLSWILGKTRNIDEVRRIFRTNIAGEINLRHTLDLYPRWIT